MSVRNSVKNGGRFHSPTTEQDREMIRAALRAERKAAELAAAEADRKRVNATPKPSAYANGNQRKVA